MTLSPGAWIEAERQSLGHDDNRYSFDGKLSALLIEENPGSAVSASLRLLRLLASLLCA